MQAQEEVIMTKGKRSKRPQLTPPLALTMATSSAELSGGGGGGCVTSDVSGSSDRVTASPSNSSDQLTHSAADEVEEDMANCLILLAKGQGQRPSQLVAPSSNTVAVAAEVYQCKTCNKCFPSFQALGGHRASHKKPNKPINLEEKKPMREKQEDFPPNRDDDKTILSLQNSVPAGSPPNKSRVHECSICGAEFGSGQALGGHMRRHRPIPAVPSGDHGESRGMKRPRNLLSLDLNLPAPEDDHPESKFPFAPKEQVIVFSASPLIDCHY